MTNISTSDIVVHLNRKVSIIRDSLANIIDCFHCKKKINLNIPGSSFSSFESHVFACVKCKLCNKFAGFKENEIGEIIFDHCKFTEHVHACSNKLYNNRKCIYIVIFVCLLFIKNMVRK